MPLTASTAERLRDYVRQRVRTDGRFFVRGTASALAAKIGKPTSWVSEYTDRPPIRHADLDTALLICDFFNVNLLKFSGRHPVTLEFTAFDIVEVPERAVQIERPESPHVRRAIKLLARMSDEGQREAAGVLATLARAFPREPPQQSAATAVGKQAGTARRGRGKQKAAG